MSVFNKQNTDETVVDIAPNRTLYVTKLTNTDAVKPEVVFGLHNTEQVFQQYQPQLKVEFENEKGGMVLEQLHFKSLDDFDPEHIAEQSGFLKNLSFEIREYYKIIHQLKTNAQLKAVLASKEKRTSMQETIKKMIATLEQNL